MMQVGESHTLNITNEEFDTFLKVLIAMKNDGVALFCCAETNLKQAGMGGASKEANKWAEQCRSRYDEMAITSSAYYIRMKQREAERLSPEK